MATDFKPGVIEISEEAYKQNTVYRPWSEIKANDPTTKPSVPPGQLQLFKDIFQTLPW